MIQQVSQLITALFDPNALWLWYEAREQELELALQWARISAGSYVKKAGKGRDSAFADECEAEAIFIVTCLIYEDWESIKVNHPDVNDRTKFYYSMVKYQLRDYWSYRASSTVSFLKKRGIVISFESISNHNHKAVEDSQLSFAELLENVLRNDTERKIFDLYCVGNKKEIIATHLNMTLKDVRKVLRDIKARIRSNAS